MVVSWVAPNSGGSPITAYRIMIRYSDSVTFAQALTNCDGSQSAIVTAKSCSIPIAVLNSAPFNLAWGSSVYAKVSAINAYGESAMSTVGNGGLLITSPSAPINLAEDVSQRTLN